MATSGSNLAPTLCDWCGKRPVLEPEGGVFDPSRWLCAECHAQTSWRELYIKRPGQTPEWIDHLCRLRARADAGQPIFGGERPPLEVQAERESGRGEAHPPRVPTARVGKNTGVKRAETVKEKEEWRRKFGLRLGVARKAANLTRDQVVAKTGVSLSGLARWEGGRCEPRPYVLKALATLYGVSEEWLLEGTGANPIGVA